MVISLELTLPNCSYTSRPRSSYSWSPASSQLTASNVSVGESSRLQFPWLSSNINIIDIHETIQPDSISTRHLYSDHVDRGGLSYAGSSDFLKRRHSNKLSLISNVLNSNQSDRLTSTQQSRRETSSSEKHFEQPDVQGEAHDPLSPNPEPPLRVPEDTKAAGRQMNFTDVELEQLSKSWLHVSQDAIIGKDRQGQTFWKSIAKDFNYQLTSKGSTTPKRTPKSLEPRWSSLNKAICKYASCVQTNKRQDNSGQAPADVIVESLSLYKSDTGSEFKDMVCYRLLRNAPKWKDNPTFLELCTPPKFDNEPNIQDKSPVFLGQSDGPIDLASLPAMDRPMGNKKAKRAKFLTPPDSLAPQILANSNSFVASAARLVEEQLLQQATLQRMLDHSILMSNITGLNEQSQADILAEKARIIARNCARRDNE